MDRFNCRLGGSKDNISEFKDKSREIIQNTTQRGKDILKNGFKKIQSQCEKEYHISNQYAWRHGERERGRDKVTEFSRTDYM